MSFIMTFSMRRIFFFTLSHQKKDHLQRISSSKSCRIPQYNLRPHLRYKLRHSPRNKAQIRSSNQPNTISQYRFIGPELDINITCHKSAMGTQLKENILRPGVITSSPQSTQLKVTSPSSFEGQSRTK